MNLTPESESLKIRFTEPEMARLTSPASPQEFTGVVKGLVDEMPRHAPRIPSHYLPHDVLHAVWRSPQIAESGLTADRTYELGTSLGLGLLAAQGNGINVRPERSIGDLI